MIYTVENVMPGCRVFNAVNLSDEIKGVTWVDIDSCTFATLVTNPMGLELTKDREHAAANIRDAHSIEVEMSNIGLPQKITIRPVV